MKNNEVVMRAKLQISRVETPYEGAEKLTFHAVCKDGGYPSDGSDEDNSYARWSPQADLTIVINNPALHGKFKVGEKFYVDFTSADVEQVSPVTYKEVSE